MGFGIKPSKGTPPELEYFEQLINGASPDQLRKQVEMLVGGARLFDSFVALGIELAPEHQQSIERKWFGRGADDTMWAIDSELEASQMHAILCQRSVEMALRRIEDPKSKVAMSARCRDGDGDGDGDGNDGEYGDGSQRVKKMRVEIRAKKSENGVTWHVDLYGPYNMCEGPERDKIEQACAAGTAERIEDVRADLPSDEEVAVMSSERIDEFVRRIDSAGPFGSLGYMGTSMAKKTDRRDGMPAVPAKLPIGVLEHFAQTASKPLGDVSITWDVVARR